MDLSPGTVIVPRSGVFCGLTSSLLEAMSDSFTASLGHVRLCAAVIALTMHTFPIVIVIVLLLDRGICTVWIETCDRWTADLFSLFQRVMNQQLVVAAQKFFWRSAGILR